MSEFKKKIVIRIPSGKEREERPQATEKEKEVVPVIEPIQEAGESKEQQQQQEAEKEEKGEELAEDVLIESALKNYEAIKMRISYVRKKDMEFQKMCATQDVSPSTIREIVSRLNREREQIVNDSRRIVELLEQAKAQYEEKFSKVEVDLYWTRLEMSMGKTEANEVETNAKITELEQQLVFLKNRIKEIDSMIKEILDLPKTVYKQSTYSELAKKLYEEMRRRYIMSRGDRGESLLSAEIQRIAESEQVPLEYATILLWRSTAYQ